MNTTTDPFNAPLFTEDDLIFVYTRQDAINDGELIDLTALAKSFGFCIPVAVTRRLWADLSNIPASRAGWESFEGRAADMLGILRMRVAVEKSRGVSTDRICFSFLLTRPCMEPISEDLDRWPAYNVVAMIHPGDEGEPVMTLCLPGEE